MQLRPEEATRIILGDISDSMTDLNRTLENINRTLSELVEESHGIYTYCISINNTLGENKR